MPEGHAFVEQYGLVSPIPDHDGTDCLKWDPSLWSHADHFKVGVAAGGWRRRRDLTVECDADGCVVGSGAGY